jgi:hypothetical protein
MIVIRRRCSIPSRKTPMGWKRCFDDPIPLPCGHDLVTLEDAGNYITELPEAIHEADEVAGSNGKPDPGGDVGRTDDVCADWRHGGRSLIHRARTRTGEGASSRGNNDEPFAFTSRNEGLHLVRGKEMPAKGSGDCS